jgi:hypothetical protein
LEFNFYPHSFYPIVYESYDFLNKKLASMIEMTHKQNKNNVIIEFDGVNGLLAVLCRDFCEQYHLIEHNKIGFKTTDSNLKEYGLATQEKVTVNFGIQCLRKICTELGSDARVTVVFQNYGLPMLHYDRLKSKKH